MDIQIDELRIDSTKYPNVANIRQDCAQMFAVLSKLP